MRFTVRDEYATRIADAEPPVPILKLRLELQTRDSVCTSGGGAAARRLPGRGRDAALLYGRTGSTFVNFNPIRLQQWIHYKYTCIYVCVSVCMRKKNDYDVEKHKKNKNKILYKCVVPTRACVRCARIRFGFLSLRFRANAETHNVQLHCCYNKYTYTE